MIATRLTMTDYAGQTRTIDLAQLTLLCAPNGAGKTTIIDALHLCFTARFPGADKVASLDEARLRGPRWGLELLDSAGGVVTWMFSGAQLAPSITIPGRAPVKGKDAVIAAIVERYGAIPTLHVRDLERLDPEALAGWIVSLCAGQSSSSLTPAACERILASKGATDMPSSAGASTLAYLDRAAAAVEAKASAARSRKAQAERDPDRKAAPKTIDPAEPAMADAALADAEAAHVAAVSRLATAQSEAKAAHEAWERETKAQRERFERLTQEHHAALRQVEDLARAKPGHVIMPSGPGPEPVPPVGADELAGMRDRLWELNVKALAEEQRFQQADKIAGACQSGACPFCGHAIDQGRIASLTEEAQAARAAFAAIGREEDALRVKIDALAAEVQRFEVALRKWTEAEKTYRSAREMAERDALRRTEIEAAIANAQAKADAAQAEIEALAPIPEPPMAETSDAEVQEARRSLDEARVRALAIRSDVEANARILSRLAEIDRQVEAERVTLDACKAVDAEVAALRSQAIGEAVGPFVAAVNARVSGRLGTLVVDLAPVARVGFMRGEAFVPVSQLSGMEIALWLAASAVAAAGLLDGSLQYVLIDDIDRLTETPRRALLDLLGDAVEMGEIGGALCALAWEPKALPVVEGWSVVGM